MSPMDAIPAEESESTPIRRRRTRSLLPFIGQAERDRALDELAERASPSIGFFLWAVLAGGVFLLAQTLQSMPMAFVAALIAPSLAPLAGLALGLATSSGRFGLRNLVAICVGIALVLGVQWLILLLLRPAYLEGIDPFVLDGPSLVIAITAATILSWQIINRPASARVSGAALWYILLGSIHIGARSLAQGDIAEAGIALLGSMAYLVLMLAAGTAAFLILGFRPQARLVFGYWGIAVAATAVFIVFGIWLGMGHSVALTDNIDPSPTPTLTITSTPSLVPSPSLTYTPSHTPTLTTTASVTPTPSPEPIEAVIRGTGGRGVFLRDAPGGASIGSLMDGEQVEIIGQPVIQDGFSWLPVRTRDGKTGWVALEFCATVTPAT